MGNINIIISPLIAVAIGILLAFCGYRIKRIAMAIIWFVIGYFLVRTYLPNLIADPFWQSVLQIAVGAILSMIGLSIEKLAISLTAGATVAMVIIRHFGPVTDWTLPAIAIACGVVAGVIAVWMMKPAVIIFTAIYGASLISINLVSLLPPEIALNIPYLEIVILAVAATAGIIYQWRNTKHIE